MLHNLQMFDAVPQPAPAEAPVPAPTRSERRLAALDRVTDKCLAMIDAVKLDGAKESADVVDKLSRAVRLTVTLQAKLEAGPPAARAERPGAKGGSPANAPGAEPDAEEVDPFAALKSGKKARVRELLRDVIDRETPDPDDNDTLVDALDERLLCDEAYDNIEDLPLRDIVERLCADLRLKPDWNRWTGEGWKPNPPFYRPRCSQFSKPSRRPILNDLPDPPLLE
jgi:hypothetical protein